MVKLSKYLLIISLSLLLPAGVFGEKSEKRELTDGELVHLNNLKEELIKEGFLALNNELNGRKRKYNVRFYSIDDPAYFMESNFSWKRVLFGTPDYKIGVNPLIFEKGIPEDALKGVLAHELTHSEHYYKGTTIKTIVPLGLKYLKRKSRIEYERRTDKEVVLKGFGEELKAYRLWQYKQLSPENLKKKKQEYLIPEEIDEIMIHMEKSNL